MATEALSPQQLLAWCRKKTWVKSALRGSRDADTLTLSPTISKKNGALCRQDQRQPNHFDLADSACGETCIRGSLQCRRGQHLGRRCSRDRIAKTDPQGGRREVSTVHLS